MASKHSDPARSPFLLAAESFDAELRRFRSLHDAAQRGGLGSQKELTRAAELLGDIAESERELGRRAATLVEALGAARAEQEGQARGVVARAVEIQRRGAELTALLQRYGALGADTGALQERLQQIAAAPREEGEAAERFALQVSEIGDAMMAIAAQARELAADAAREGFEDIERQAGSLRQQLAAAKGKLGAFARKRGPGGAP